MKRSEVFMQRAQYFCHTLIKFGFSRHIFIINLNTKLHGDPHRARRAHTCGKTHGRSWRRQQALLATRLTRLAQFLAKRSYKCNTALSESPWNSVHYSWVRSVHQKHCNQFSKNNSPQKMGSSPLPHSLLFFPKEVIFLHYFSALFDCSLDCFAGFFFFFTLLDCFSFSSTWKDLTQAFHV
jgi:hypothetical protein